MMIDLRVAFLASRFVISSICTLSEAVSPRPRAYVMSFSVRVRVKSSSLSMRFLRRPSRPVIEVLPGNSPILSTGNRPSLVRYRPTAS